MSTTITVSVERYPEVLQSCTHGPAEEVGWFGLITEDVFASENHRGIRYVPDPERQFLRKLSRQWSTVRNFDLDSGSSPGNPQAAFVVGEWRPLFHMRSWIPNNLERFDNFKPNIVSSARTLQLLLSTCSYVRSESTQYVACKRMDTIYLTCSKVYDNLPIAAIRSARLDKFERLLTTQGDGGNPEFEPQGPYAAYFCSVLGRTFDNIKVLYTQQIDCMDTTLPCTAHPPANYVKLILVKPNSWLHVPRNLPFCRWGEQSPYREAWTKSFTNGCAQAIVGHRNDNILERCELMQTEHIPDKANCLKPRCYYHWSKQRSISFLKQVLELVQHTVKENYDSAVYGFTIDHSGKHTMAIQTTEWRLESWILEFRRKQHTSHVGW